MPLIHTRWPTFAALVAGIGAVALIWFILLSNPSGEAVPASGGTYVEGVIRPPERINPLYAAANPVDRDLSALVFNGLVRLAPDGTPQPDLAERWEISGGTTYIFHLRQGVAWQDDPNNRFDADDVVFTFDAISDPAFRGDPALAQLMQGVVVTARDAQTVEFRLEQAYAPFLTYLTVGLLPEHLLGGLDADALYNAEFNARPVGTGPYRVKGRTATEVVLESNSTYHFGPPRISTMEFRIFPDRPALYGALRSRDVHGALLPPDTPEDEIDLLTEDPAYALRELTATSVIVVYFDTESPLFEDAEVRKALVQGVNPRAVAEAVSGGRGAQAQTGIPTSSWAYTRVDTLEFDPGAGASALESEGWARASDGVRRKGGQRFSFTLSTSNDPYRLAMAENVAQQLRLLGVEVFVEPLAGESFIEDHVLSRNFEAAILEIDPGADPDPYPFWHSSQIAPPGRNLAGLNNPLVDNVLQRARQNTDIAQRREYYEAFEGLLIGAAPAILLYAPVYVYAQSSEVQGFAPSLLFSGAARLANVNEWYMRTRVE